MMKFLNPTSNVLNLVPIGLGLVQPGATVQVEEYLYRPVLKANGGRGKSSIEEVAPQMQPVADQGWVDAWRNAPTPPKPVSRVVTSETLHQLPPAILEARRAFDAARAAGEAPAAEAIPAEDPPEAPKRRGRPPKRILDADVAASNPGVTSGILDTED